VTGCPITGDAEVRVEPGGPVWVRSDPEIHIVADLLHTAEARAFIDTRYTVGEWCPYQSGVVHARLRDAEPRPTPVIRVAGFCPMGCGATLFVGEGGYITCSWVECPRPDAVAEILEDRRETEHLVELQAATFTLQHPLRERLDGALFACGIHDTIRRLDGPPAPPGMYRTSDGREFTPVPGEG
jgi:hypothetical protein